MISTGSAGAQVGTAELDLAKSVSQPTAEPNEDFIFFLSYSCSSLTEPCVGATITDTLPPEVSRTAADVQFGGNFADVNYNPATGTAVFTLFTPLPAGTTAQLSITVHFPAGTAPGVTATNQASMSATNAATTQSNQVTVTAIAASSWTVSKSGVGGAAAQLDTPFTYRVGITLAAGGTQNINNARFVDTLPPGAQFVSATGGGVHDPATNTVTWALGTLVPAANNAVTTTREVTVIFPSSTFQAGDRPVNNVEAFGAPAGEPDQSLGTAQFPVTLRQAGNITGASKRDTLGSLGPGQSDTYTIRGTNPNPGPLDAFTILEDLPVQLSMVQDGSPNLTGTGTAPQVSWRGLTGAFQPIATSPSGGGWGATIPATADQIQLAYGTVPAAFTAAATLRAGIPANGIGRDGVPIPAGATIRNCITVTANLNGTAVIPRSSCTDQTVVPLSVLFSKERTSAPVVPPSGEVTWQIGVGVDANSASDLVNPVLTDCLPPDLDLVDPLNPTSTINATTTGLSAAPVLTRAAGGCGTGQVLLTWSWAGPFTLARGASGTITLNTRVSNTAAPATVTNVSTLSATNLTATIQRQANVTITSTTVLLGTKAVKGDLDTSFVGFGTIGQTSRGGGARYEAVIANISDIPVRNVVLIDTLPIPGDTGVLSPVARGSAWTPLFAGGVTTGAAATVEYSTSHNPCRPEIGTPGTCDPPNWTSTPPSPLSSVGALKINYGSFVLPPGGALRFGFDVATPSNAPIGQVAWNSFGYSAIRADNNEQLVPSEPRKVGLEVAGSEPPEEPPGIALLKFVNGIHAPNPPGPTIPAGSSVVFTYRVTNTSDLTLVDITLVDDEIGVVTCPKTTLAPGESMLCTSASFPAITGQYDNVATVTGQPVDSSGQAFGPPLTDTDKGHYTNGELPDTGSSTDRLVQVGGLLLLLGLGFLALTRRPRPAQETP